MVVFYTKKMQKNPSTFLKTDENNIINETQIRWVKKMNECLEVCTKANGCVSDAKHNDTHTICKINNPDSYQRLNQYFQ
jgi:hypothetical protein